MGCTMGNRATLTALPRSQRLAFIGGLFLFLDFQRTGATTSLPAGTLPTGPTAVRRQNVLGLELWVEDLSNPHECA
jgi:hypothetical protein